MAMKVLGKVAKNKVSLIAIEKMAYLLKREIEQGVKIKQYEIAMVLANI